MKVIAVIPCYNEAKQIYQVVSGALKYVDEVIVVDNCSIDSTDYMAREAGAKVIYCRDKGMGHATKAGITQAIKHGANVIVTLDGDGQHNPKEIPSILEPIFRHRCDISIGVRTKHAMPIYRRFGNFLITLSFNLFSTITLPDAQCGFRAFTVKVVRAIELKEGGFGCIVEFLVKARHRKYRIERVPITCIYHNHLADNSTMNPVKHGLSVLLSSIKWRIWEAIHE